MLPNSDLAFVRTKPACLQPERSARPLAGISHGSKSKPLLRIATHLCVLTVLIIHRRLKPHLQVEI